MASALQYLLERHDRAGLKGAARLVAVSTSCGSLRFLDAGGVLIPASADDILQRLAGYCTAMNQNATSSTLTGH
jgi:hypothetical protein